MKNAATTEQTLLTNHKPEQYIRRRPSESTFLATALIICHFSIVVVSNWLPIFLEWPWERIETELAEASVV
uniref:Anoctamin n=1 Tax=Mesocestoides corti TaxID=53468 RepID=A0A5K3ELI9_MESCO